MNILIKLSWLLYFCLAPVAWLPIPGLTAQYLYYIKLGLIGSAVAMTWVYLFGKNSFHLPKGLLGPIGLALALLLGMSGFIQADNLAYAIKRYQDFALGFIMFWTMYMYSRYTDDVLKIFFMSSLFVSALASLTVLTKLTGFPALNAPAIFEYQSISVAGFGGKRGNWSNSIALYLAPLLIYLAGRKNTFIFPVVMLTCCLFILGSQFAVSGRTGLLASLFILILAAVFVFKSRKTLLLIIVVGVISIIVMGDQVAEISQSQLRLDNVSRAESGEILAKLNALSTGRLYQFIEALSLIADNPVFGYGFGERVMGLDVHNLWLRLAIESGVFLPIFFLIFIKILLGKVSSKGLLHSAKKYSKSMVQTDTVNQQRRKILGFMLVAGVIMSFLQPNILLGSFQVTAIWWATAGVLLSMQVNTQLKGSKENVTIKQEDNKVNLFNIRKRAILSATTTEKIK